MHPLLLIVTLGLNLAADPAPKSVSQPPTTRSLAAGWEPGLVGEYFQLEPTLDDFPELPKDRKPDLIRIDKQINFASTQEAWTGTTFVDNFYVRWTGRILIPKSGTYTLFLNSDDGSRLFLDGKQILVNGGTHDMVELSAKTELMAGEHELKFEYFESEIDSGCIFSWQGPDLPKQTVPATAFSHMASPATR